MRPITVFIIFWFAMISATQLSVAQCPGNVVLNSSLDGEMGFNTPAPDWIPDGSPDLNSPNSTEPNNGWTWLSNPIFSNDGGTWQNLYLLESVTQFVNLVPGQSYTLQFEYTSHAISSLTGDVIDGPAGVKVFFDSVQVYQTPNDSTLNTWETACYSFTATSPVLELRFQAKNDNYAGLDGICLTTSATLPRDVLGPDTVACEFPMVLTGAMIGTYTWQDSIPGPQLTVSQPGTYVVEVNTGCIPVVDTIVVDSQEVSELHLGPDTAICPHRPLLLDASINGGISYLWQDGTAGPLYRVDREGLYQVIAQTACDQKTDLIYVVEKPCPCEVLIPNVFSPNGDGINDRFLVTADCFPPADFSMKVFDRWGNSLFGTLDPQTGWDGNRGGKPLPTGVYYYTIRYTWQWGETEHSTGSLTLVR